MKKRAFFISMIIFAIILISTSVANAMEDQALFKSRQTIGKRVFGASITQYTESVKQKNAAVVEYDIEDILTTITFAEAIDFEQLESYIAAYGINLAQIQLRGLTPDGVKVSIFSRTSMGLKETEKFLFEQAKLEGYSIVGITGAFALIDSCNLQAVQNDKLTFLADTSNDGFFRGYKQKDSYSRNELEKENGKSQFPPAIYWDIEDAGVIN